MSNKTVKAAVIGTGLIGEQHVETYANYPRAELAMVHDLNLDRAKKVAETFGCAATSNLDDIANSDVEVVSVATPDHLHHDATIAMLEAGKHVVVEKPLATITSEAQAMVDLAADKGVRLTLNLGNRWSPGFLDIKDSVVSGEIGTPQIAHCRVADTIWVPTEMLSWAGQSGPQWFLFAHTMDLIRWFLDQEAVEVYASGTKDVLKSKGIDAFDTIQAMVKFENSSAMFETSWIIPEAWPSLVEFELTLNGEDGRLGYNGVNQGFELTSNTNNRHMWSRPAQWNYFKLPDWWWGSVRDMVDSVLDDKDVAIPATDGVAVTAMIEATERSIAEGRPVKVSELR